MTNKVELNELTQVVHKEQAFLVALNENFRRVQPAINDTLSRSGVVPNQMEEVLDMNGRKIINVGYKDSLHPDNPADEALTKRYIQGLIQEVEDAIARLTDLTNQAIAAVQLYYTENIYPDMIAAKEDAQQAAHDAKGYYDDTKALYDELSGLAQNLDALLAIYSDIAKLNTLYSHLDDIEALADDEVIADLKTCAENISAIMAAPTWAANAQTWAEGTDTAVEYLGGTHSAKRWAEIAEEAAQSSTTYKEFKPSWTTDSTTSAFLEDVYADSDAVVGMAYLGSLECTDLPTGLSNVEAVVEILPSATSSPCNYYKW